MSGRTPSKAMPVAETGITERRGGRQQKYDWDDKRDICYKLYVQEKKSPRQIVRHFCELFNVDESELPSERCFRRQFNEIWKFPPRRGARLTAETEPIVVERMKELWEQNLDIAKIRQTLEDEGWEMGNNEFRKLRRTTGCMRRGTVGAFVVMPEGVQPKRNWSKKRGFIEMNPDPRTVAMQQTAAEAEELSVLQQQNLATLTPAESARRAQRLIDLQAKDEQAFASRKRRRRIRGFGHLPADAPGMAPRYESETTLDESKAYLHLSNEMYTTIKDDFEVIAREMNIERKKTHIQDGKWQAAKDRLVAENLHLSEMMHPLQPDLDKRVIGLDVICQDVTKRIRDEGKRLTIAQANVVLGLNPSSSKTLRRAFYDILANDKFTTRLACGDEHWEELQAAWRATSPLLQQVAAENDPQKVKAVYTLCRDATKRYNDNMIKMDPNRKQFQRPDYGPGPGAVRTNRRKTADTAIPPAPSAAARPQRQIGQGQTFDPGLDPALCNPYDPGPVSIAVYFRLSPQSKLVGNHPRLWLGNLTSRTMAAVTEAATAKAAATTVTRVHGVIKQDDGQEANYQIDGDDELAVYLEAAGDKSTFVVQLEGGYA